MANKLDWSPQGYRTRIRAGRGQQLRITLATPDGLSEKRREEIARARLEQLELMSRSLTAKGLTREAAYLLKKAAEQKTDEAFALCVQTAASLAPRPLSNGDKPRTFQELGELWTSGELHRLYPDNVKSKASADDDERLLGWHYRTIGEVLLTDFCIDHYWRAMRALPPTAVRPMTRRHYAQVIAKVLRLAVFPCEVIAAYPLPPRDLLPKVVKGDIVFPYLYPDEDLLLMQTRPLELPSFCSDEDEHLVYRAFFGTLNREGMRIDECLGMQWKLQDFTHGVINIGPRKNGRTGMWPAAEGTLEALEVLRERFGGEGPFARLPKDEKYAWRYREMLLAAGVDRHALHHNEPGRRKLRGHDTRSTMVTLRLANGWSENQVSTRTGHMSSDMINTYKRQAATVAELGHTHFLTPLDVALGLRVLADGPVAPVAAERQNESTSSATGESGSWGESAGETETPPPGASPGAFASESLSSYQGVAKTGLEPVRPCGRRILKPPREPGKPSFQGVPMNGTPPNAPDASASEGPSRQPEADPAHAFLEQLRAAAHAAVMAGKWEDVAEIGKLIDRAAGTARAPAEAAPAPSSAGTSALPSTVAPAASVVELSSRRRRGAP